VLELLMEAGVPVSAYDLLARLRGTRSAAPPTIYRALDFLIEQGLVHRVERLGAFVSCLEPGHHSLPVHFLICRACGEVREIEDPMLETALHQLARRAGYVPDRSTVEIEGLCPRCQIGHAAPAAAQAAPSDAA
jgi:Fur family zinc uptake transcriptional regulator